MIAVAPRSDRRLSSFFATNCNQKTNLGTTRYVISTMNPIKINKEIAGYTFEMNGAFVKACILISGK